VAVPVGTAAVVLFNEEVPFGFPSFGAATSFVEYQVGDNDIVATIIAEALDKGVVIGANKYQILDTNSYEDIYGEDEDDSEE
jgi:hypothetical protein